MEQERKELLNNESEDRAKNKTGLVLEGGGMRGIYTAGVLDVFLDEGLEFDGVIGVSAGAVHGCSFLSGQRGRSIRYYKKYCADKRFMSAENMIRTGNFVDTDFCYHELPEVLDPYDYEAFDRNKEKTDFYEKYYVNPGSVSIPKEESRHSYMLWENGVFTWKDVETGEIWRTESVKE